MEKKEGEGRGIGRDTGGRKKQGGKEEIGREVEEAGREVRNRMVKR